jgi:hypothetical protein
MTSLERSSWRGPETRSSPPAVDRRKAQMPQTVPASFERITQHPPPSWEDWTSGTLSCGEFSDDYSKRRKNRHRNRLKISKFVSTVPKARNSQVCSNSMGRQLDILVMRSGGDRKQRRDRRPRWSSHRGEDQRLEVRPQLIGGRRKGLKQCHMFHVTNFCKINLYC